MTAPAARALLAMLLAHGWHATTIDGAGHVEVSTYGKVRGDGTRPRLVGQVPCRSVAVRAHHPDGRALVAVWETHTRTAKGADSWTRLLARRGRVGGEVAPRPLTAADLAAYVEGVS